MEWNYKAPCFVWVDSERDRVDLGSYGSLDVLFGFWGWINPASYGALFLGRRVVRFGCFFTNTLRSLETWEVTFGLLINIELEKNIVNICVVFTLKKLLKPNLIPRSKAISILFNCPSI